MAPGTDPDELLNEPVKVATNCRENKQISNIQVHSKALEFTTFGKFVATQNRENPRAITKLTSNEYLRPAVATRGFKGFFT
ncbi:hypothetical protein [Aeromonas eucrenophila]|uniref:Uncharacterized protein n=1 Tax=Aeromonas eucrenophila TaxID=649 RepID=A0ABW0Y861_9GAMM|nr:hypothetical protein [Aeromonas eucrenophila]